MREQEPISKVENIYVSKHAKLLIVARTERQINLKYPFVFNPFYSVFFFILLFSFYKQQILFQRK